MRIETLVVVYHNDRVLLELKRKREGKSFGVGKWNGYGGLKNGETLSCMINGREYVE